MKLASNLRIFTTGKTRSGKSNFVKKVLIPQYRSFIIWDIKREYSDFGAVVSSISQLERLLAGGCKKVVFQPSLVSEDLFNELCKFIYLYVRNFVFIVDELQEICTKGYMPPYFKTLVTTTQGEPYNIGIVGITQRPQLVHNTFISNCTVVVAFKLHLEADAKAVGCIPAERIMSLAQYHCLVYNDLLHENPIVECPPV